MTTTVTPWAIGNRITATKLNNQSVAITEQQAVYTALDSRVDALESATPLTYSYTATFSEAAGGWDSYGAGWPSIGSFTGTSSGVAVGSAGVYLVTHTVHATSGAWTGVTHHRIDVGGVTYGVSSTVPNLGEDFASVSCVTPHISAGIGIVPVYRNGGGTQRYVNVTLTIVRVSV